MNKRIRYVVFGLIPISVVAFMIYLFASHNLAVLEPSGIIAEQQKKLLLFALALSLLVVLPVFTLTAFIVFKYREGNKKAHYKPEWDHNKKLEILWWGIPITIIVILSVVTWISSHTLDPFRPIATTEEPVRIQVIALQWKWLFIYPDENIASVNYFEIPVNRPVNFQLTSDAPMNAFWIPKLGSQIYTMSGMSTELHLMASEAGEYSGQSANISGQGFADMKFTVKAAGQNDYSSWLANMKQGETVLDQTEYSHLSEPATLQNPLFYNHVSFNVFDSAVNKYMHHTSSMSTFDHQKNLTNALRAVGT